MLPNGFDAEMAALVQEAREEVARRTVDLVILLESDEPRPKIQQHAHKLAGLAAQFDAVRIAEAADRIEQACANGLAPGDCLPDLKSALAGAMGTRPS